MIGETIEKKPLNRSLSNRSHTKRDAKLRLKLLLAREQLKGEDNIRKRVNAMKNLQLEVIALVITLKIKSIKRSNTYKNDYNYCLYVLH